MQNVLVRSKKIARAIVESGKACLTIAELSGRLGLPVDLVLADCEAMEARGWLALWMRPDELAVTLTPASAARLSVGLLERGTGREPCWAPVGDPRHHRPERSRSRLAGEAAQWVEDRAGFEPGQLDDPTSARKSDRTLPGRAAPRPRLIAGCSFWPWPGPAAWKGTICPVCQSRPLSPGEYCLGCDRIGSVPSRRRSLPRSIAQEEEAARKAREIRKARRRARLSLRSSRKHPH